VGSCIAYAVVVLSLLVLDKTEKLGIFLGFVMMGMVILFLVVVAKIGLSWTDFGWGLIPNLPEKSEQSAEPADIIISLVGTTSIGFNLFLGGSMAKGREMGSAQRGIAFSTGSAFVVSVLILIVGAGFHAESQEQSRSFTISDLADFIETVVFKTGVIIFSLGFIAAALSSMLTVPLGAALTAESVFSDEEKETTEKIGMDNPNFEDDVPANGKINNNAKVEIEDNQTSSPQKLPKWIYLGIMFVMVAIATIVISANADRTQVILVAQVFNGCLLPFFSICLLLCINDKRFMSEKPQKGWSNLFLFISVTITLFLASNVIIQKIFGSLITSVAVRLLLAVGVAVGGMAILCLATTLGKDLIRSLKTC